jgi:hypothetical protein
VRLDKVELLEASSKVLKQYLPKLNGLSEYERSEIFTIYSMLKYLTMEFKYSEKCSSQKDDACLVLKKKINETLLQNSHETKNTKVVSNLEVTDILTFIFESNFSKQVTDSMNSHFIDYFDSFNKAELQMFK